MSKLNTLPRPNRTAVLDLGRNWNTPTLGRTIREAFRRVYGFDPKGALAGERAENLKGLIKRDEMPRCFCAFIR